MARYIKGLIYELERSSTPEFAYENVYISSLKKLYKIKPNGMSVVYDIGKEVLFNFLKGGLWINHSKNNGPQKTCFVDLFNKDINYPEIEAFIGSKPIDLGENLLLGFNYEADPSYLFIDDIQKSSRVKATGYFSDYSFDGVHVFSKDRVNDLLVCFNLKLDQVWSVKLEGQDYGGWTHKPQLFGDLILVNHAFNIIALHKEDGQEVWRYSFKMQSHGPTCCNLIGEKVFAESCGTGYVIDPRNGEVIHEIPLGFSSTKQGKHKRIYFYPFQDKLVALSENDNAVRLFSGDGAELLHELQCPKEYQISDNSQPVVTEDAIYQSVYSKMASAGGVLVLAPTEIDVSGTIEIQPRPEIHVLKQPEDDGKHAYNLYVDAHDADTLNRFGQIVIREIHMETGSEVYSDQLEYDSRDKYHNGKINYFVDPSQLSESEKERLQNDIDELETSRRRGQLAGDGISDIKINVVFKPKSEWDLSSAPLDIKQRRETRWANRPVSDLS